MTTTEDERPTIGESYGIAVRTSNLKVSLEKRTQADLIMAAGMQHERLGVLLLRLQSEYDGIKAEIEHAGDNARAQEAAAAKVERVQTDEIDGAGLAQAMRRRSEGEILTERYLILSRLTTLREAKQEVAAFAIVLATKQRYMRNDEIVGKLAGQVLDVFLNPTCASCEGTGFKGSGYRGEKPEPCRACRLTGVRRYSLGNDDRARWFAGELLAELQRKMAEAASGMGRLLSNK